VGPSTSSDESEAVPAYNEHENAEVESLEAPSPSESPLTSRQLAKHQRRVGYFDLHPDRRHALAQTSLYDDEDEMRAKLGEDSDDDIDDERAYGPPSPGVREVRRLPVPPGQQLVDSIATLTEKHSSTDIANGNEGSIAPATPSKTATLIEMYRERERGSPPNAGITNSVPIIMAPVAPSRLPVRVTLSKEGAPLPQPALLSTSPPKPSPKLLVESTTRNEPPCIVLEETGRGSPARYKHGAPLHNVLEEEEE